jgi:hypothetical protein
MKFKDFIGPVLGALLLVGFVFLGVVKFRGNSSETPRVEKTVQVSAEEIPDLAPGFSYDLPWAGGSVNVYIEDLTVDETPKGENLVLNVALKNNSPETFFISDVGWRLLDSERFVVEESGVYVPVADTFGFDSFFFTFVEPNVGKRETVGYLVSSGDYYLSIGGKTVARIPIR